MLETNTPARQTYSCRLSKSYPIVLAVFAGQFSCSLAELQMRSRVSVVGQRSSVWSSSLSEGCSSVLVVPCHLDTRQRYYPCIREYSSPRVTQAKFSVILLQSDTCSGGKKCMCCHTVVSATSIFPQPKQHNESCETWSVIFLYTVYCGL